MMNKHNMKNKLLVLLGIIVAVIICAYQFDPAIKAYTEMDKKTEIRKRHEIPLPAYNRLQSKRIKQFENFI